MKRLNKILFSVLLTLFLFSRSTAQIMAMETSFRLPVEIVLEGDRPLHQETFVVEMRALTVGAPMPEQTENQKCTIEIQGQGKKEFLPVKFTQPNIYQYEVTLKKGNKERYTYDPSVYKVTVYCTADSVHGLETTVVAQEQGKEEVKKDAVRFVNSYKAPAETEAPQASGQGYQNKPVKTGDKTPVGILVCILATSGLVILVLTTKKAKR